MTEITQTPEPPYFAVIFTSLRTEGDNGYNEMSEKMIKLAAKQKGFLGMDSARNQVGITVSYWKDLDAILQWKNNAEHKLARVKGRTEWYRSFKVRIAKVEREYGFN